MFRGKIAHMLDLWPVAGIDQTLDAERIPHNIGDLMIERRVD